MITDYKTGKAPSEQYAQKAFFALKIYALLIRTSQGVTPDRVRLLYLNGPTVYTLDINDAQLDAMHQQLTALWGAINKAIATDIWPARESVLCGWCDFKETLCPAFNTADEIAVNKVAIDDEMARRADTEVTGAEPLGDTTTAALTAEGIAEERTAVEIATDSDGTAITGVAPDIAATAEPGATAISATEAVSGG